MRIRILGLLLFLANTVAGQIAAVDVKSGSTNSEVTDIVVVFKMHVDIGYTGWAEGVLQKYTSEMLDETLLSIDKTSSLPKNEQFVWTMPSWPLFYMMENSHGERKTKLHNAVQKGRIVPHALPITFETEACDLENLVSGLKYAEEVNKIAGKPAPRGAKLTDVPSHSRVLPTLLKNAGVDFLHLGCNPGSTAPELPVLFWWQGPDGSKLLTFYWSEYYGSDILPPKNWPHKTWLAMIHTHENSGAPHPEEVAKLLEKARQELPNARIHIGELSDFYDLLMKEKPELPVISDDMPDTWIHGYMSNPKETKLSKQLQRSTYNTEALNTQLQCWGATQNNISKQIDEATEQMILYEEHTFGAAMTHADQHKWTYDDEFKIEKSLGSYEFLEGTWVEKRNRIRNAEKIVVPLQKQQLKTLAASVNVEGKKIVVYNSLPWKRSGHVSLFGGIYQKRFNIYGLKNCWTGSVVPVHENYNFLSFIAEDVPAMGYVTYELLTEKPLNYQSDLIIDESKGLLENKFFRIEIDKGTGALNSVFDKKQKKELVDKNSKYGFGNYLFQQVGQEEIETYNKNYVKPGSEGWANDEMIRPGIPHKKGKIRTGTAKKIVYKHMGNSIRASVFGEIAELEGHDYILNFTLYDNLPYVEVTWGADGKKPDSRPEAGWLAWSFNIKKPEYRLQRTGGIVNPQKDYIKNTNHDFYFLNTSMAMFDNSGSGVALNCPEAPGISIDEPGLFSYSKTKELKTGHVFSNLYNTQWGTNFTEWIEGSFSSKFYIWSYKSYDAEKTFITPGEETRNPLTGVYHDTNAGDLAASQAGIQLNKKGVLVTAFGKNRYGEGTVLRLWEQAGSEQYVRIQLPKGNDFKTASFCNLRGQKTNQNKIEIENDAFEVKILANQPLSFILE